MQLPLSFRLPCFFSLCHASPTSSLFSFDHADCLTSGRQPFSCVCHVGVCLFLFSRGVKNACCYWGVLPHCVVSRQHHFVTNPHTCLFTIRSFSHFLGRCFRHRAKLHWPVQFFYSIFSLPELTGAASI